MTYTFRGIELPHHLRESLDAYVDRGRPTGDFLRACLENNLSLAFGLADEESLRALHTIVAYLYNECPAPCWGSPEKVAAWLEEPPSMSGTGRTKKGR